MKRKTTLFLNILLFFSISSFATELPTEVQCDKEDLKCVEKILQILDSVKNNDFYPYLDITNKAYSISKSLNYNYGIAQASLYKGIIYSQKSEWDKALNFLYEAEKMASTNNFENLEDILTNIGIVYGNINDFEKSLVIYEKLRKILESNPKTAPIDFIKNYINTGKTYYNLKDYKQAIQWNIKALNISRKNQLPFGEAIACAALSADYLELFQLDSAQFFGEKSLQISKKNGYKRLELSAVQNIGSSYFYGKKYSKAIPFIENAVELSKETEDIYYLAENTFLLTSIYDSLKQFDKAYFHLKKYKVLNDSIYNDEKRTTIAEIQTKYETEKKESQIRQLEQERELQNLQSSRKNYLIGGITTFSFLAMIIGYLAFNRYKAKQENILLQKEKEQTESELTALKAQMNPHFIFNALNSIQEMFILGDKKLANQHLGKFSELTRKVLEASSKKLIDIEDEIHLLTLYLDLEKARFEEDFSFEIENLANEYENLKLPPMIVQPFVENAIKHGLFHKTGTKSLHIRFEYVENSQQIICEINDNGIGREAAMQIKALNPFSPTSFSTAATEKRLALLNNTKNKNVNIEYFDKKDIHGNAEGTRVMILISV